MMMNEMIEVKTAELIGPALDWAVGNAIGENNQIDSRFIDDERGQAKVVSWCWNAYSADWGVGGPLIEARVTALNQTGTHTWWAHSEDRLGVGETAMIAACRAIVAAKFGDTVQVPKELVQ